MPGTETPPSNIQRPDLSNSPLMTASAVSASSGARINSQPGELRSEGLEDVSGGIPANLPEDPRTQTSRQVYSPRQPKAPVSPEPVEMVSSPNPYAYLPSLYDLYMQAAPRTGRLERFGLDVFRREPQKPRDSHGSARRPGLCPGPW